MVLPDGTTSFHALQNACRAARGRTLVYFAFDLLHLDGYDLTRVPLERRKEALRPLLPAGAAARCATATTSSARAATSSSRPAG